MTGPPLEPDDDGREHPIDAAMRGAHRAPLVPGRPSRGFTWGMRALLLVPTVAIVSAVRGVAPTPDTTRLALFVVVAGLLAVLVAVLWWAVGRPRLTDNQSTQLRAELGPGGMRRLRRALWSPQPVPAELRPWIEPYLSTVFSPGPILGIAAGTTFGGSSTLISVSHPETSSLSQLVFLLVVGALSAAGITLVGGAQVLRRRARHTYLPTDPPPSSP